MKHFILILLSIILVNCSNIKIPNYKPLNLSENGTRIFNKKIINDKRINYDIMELSDNKYKEDAGYYYLKTQNYEIISDIDGIELFSLEPTYLIKDNNVTQINIPSDYLTWTVQNIIAYPTYLEFKFFNYGSYKEVLLKYDIKSQKFINKEKSVSEKFVFISSFENSGFTEKYNEDKIQFKDNFTHGEFKEKTEVTLLNNETSDVCKTIIKDNIKAGYDNITNNDIFSKSSLSKCKTFISRLGILENNIEYEHIDLPKITNKDIQEISKKVELPEGYLDNNKNIYKIEKPYKIYIINNEKFNDASYIIFDDKSGSTYVTKYVENYFKLNGNYYILMWQQKPETCARGMYLYKITNDGLKLITKNNDLAI